MMQALGVSLDVIDRCQNHVLAGSRARRHYQHLDYAEEKKCAWNLPGDRLSAAAIGLLQQPFPMKDSVIESPLMKTVRNDRSPIAWVLYASILFSLFACGIHHGQMSALGMSGLNGGFCSLSSEHGRYMDAGDSDDSAPHLATQLSCPLCSSFAVAVAINTLPWALDYVPGNTVNPIIVRSLAQPPPRYVWPALNPRASPDTSLAVTLSA